MFPLYSNPVLKFCSNNKRVIYTNILSARWVRKAWNMCTRVHVPIEMGHWQSGVGLAFLGKRFEGEGSLCFILKEGNKKQHWPDVMTVSLCCPFDWLQNHPRDTQEPGVSVKVIPDRTEKARSALMWVATAHEPVSNLNKRWKRRKQDDLWNSSFCFQSAQMWANSLTLLQPHLDRCSRHHAFLIMLGSALISVPEQTLPLFSCFPWGIWLKQWEK